MQELEEWILRQLVVMRVKMKSPGRIYQDYNFIVSGFDGCEIEELLGLVDINAPDTQPIVVNLKATNHSWQRFFLDTGIGVWEDWGELVDEVEENETKIVDYGDLFNLKGKIISSITCVNSQIKIKCESGLELVLRFIDEKDLESDSEILISKN